MVMTNKDIDKLVAHKPDYVITANSFYYIGQKTENGSGTPK